MNKEEKSQVIADLRDKFSKAKAVVFTDYKGMTVKELTDLRILLRKSSLEYRVVKNTLARIASQETEFSEMKDFLTGPVGVAIGYDDPVLVVKKISDFAKGQEKLKVKGAIVEGKRFSKDEIRELAELPSREVLLSMLAGVMQAPLGKLARLLSATVSSLGYAMESLKAKKEN